MIKVILKIREYSLFFFFISLSISPLWADDIVNDWFGASNFVHQYYGMTKDLNKKTNKQTNKQKNKKPNSKVVAPQKTPPLSSQQPSQTLQPIPPKSIAPFVQGGKSTPSTKSTKQAKKPSKSSNNSGIATTFNDLLNDTALQSSNPSTTPKATAPITPPTSSSKTNIPNAQGQTKAKVPSAQPRVPEAANPIIPKGLQQSNSIPRVQPPLPQQEQAAPPTPPQQEQVAPPLPQQEQAAPPLPQQEQAAPPLPQQEQVAPPAPPQQEQAAPPVPSQTKNKPPKSFQEDGLEVQLQGVDSNFSNYGNNKKSEQSYKKAQNTLRKEVRKHTASKKKGYVDNNSFFIALSPQYLTFDTNANSIFAFVFPQSKAYGLDATYGYQTRWFDYLFIRAMGSLVAQYSQGSTKDRIKFPSSDGQMIDFTVTTDISIPLSVSGLFSIGFPIGKNTIPYIAFGPKVILYRVSVNVSGELNKVTSPFPGGMAEIGIIRAFSDSFALYFAFQKSMFISYSKPIYYAGGESSLKIQPVSTVLKFGLIWNF